MSFEIVIFENYDIYDGIDEIVNEKEAVDEFIKFSKKYVSSIPTYFGKQNTKITFGSIFVGYADISGEDKSKNVLLLGKLSEESKKYIKEQLPELPEKEVSE